MLRNNPGFVKDSVNEATEVLSGMLNTHKCLLESGVEIQKRLESYPASKRMGIFRGPRSASLIDIPKKLKKKDPGPGKSRSSQVHCAELISTRRAVPKTGLKFLRGPARRTLHSRRTQESGWETQGKYSTGGQRGAKRDPQRGDGGIPGDPPGSL